MLVTFTTSSYSDITLFGDVAVVLLKKMGLSGNVPGALMPEDLESALASLRQALAQEAAANAPVLDSATPTGAGDDHPPPVPLATRAGPLIELLEAAIASSAPVLWNP